ncbi:hypothetical protein EVG20_g8859 [Dentipellis fragilis]|uniref:Uncharacterized protein n=1 Tax=Dentipellis fragilis TaxID=205917 RepID=A0A4Y9Y3E0_9AGAM|nr:hypothetical protein EVG20_g8859 [Dentipellis fragilis]
MNHESERGVKVKMCSDASNRSGSMNMNRMYNENENELKTKTASERTGRGGHGGRVTGGGVMTAMATATTAETTTVAEVERRRDERLEVAAKMLVHELKRWLQGGR